MFRFLLFLGIFTSSANLLAEEALSTPEKIEKTQEFITEENTKNIENIVNKSQLKVGFINIRRVMANAPQNEKIRTLLDAEFRQEQQEILSLQAELSKSEQNLLNQEIGAERENLERELVTKRRDLIQRDADFRENYNIRRNEEIIKLQDLIMVVIIELAQQKNYDVILNDSGVLYVSENADLTLEVIKRLHEKGDL